MSRLVCAERLTRLEVETSAWLVETGLIGSEISGLLTGFADRLLAGGVPLSRAYLAMATINPDFRSLSVTWRGESGASRGFVEHERFPTAFEASPVAYLLQRDLPRRRWRVADEGGTEGFELLKELRQEGHTDYIAEIVRFGASAEFAVPGIALTACTDAPGGFADGEVRMLSALTRPLALATYRISLFDLAVSLLGAYVGHDAGHRILSGEIRRGHGQSVDAALMVADLSGFTALAESGGEAVVARLGEHLAAMVEPVERGGGEVLKFLGDGILAGFPIADGDHPGAACAAALSAARHALEENETVNRRHGEAQPLPLKIGLHRGRVFYGNLGAGSRLDFTVIGPAVNEASRLCRLCGELSRPILMSDGFARHCGGPATSLGWHVLRGVAEPREIHTPGAR